MRSLGFPGCLAVVGAMALASCTVGRVPGAAAPEAAAASRAEVPDGGFGALLNAQRAAAGLPAATPDARLTAAAQAHAADMVTRDYFSHTSPEGRSSADRIRAAGYDTCRPSENIAFGQMSETAVFQGWINSPGHRANMLMRGPVQYGLGMAGTKHVLVVAGVC